MLAASRDAVASGGTRRAPTPSITEVEAFRLVPTSQIADYAKATPLGSIALPGGATGFNFGSIRLADNETVPIKLEPNSPPPE